MTFFHSLKPFQVKATAPLISCLSGLDYSGWETQMTEFPGITILPWVIIYRICGYLGRIVLRRHDKANTGWLLGILFRSAWIDYSHDNLPKAKGGKYQINKNI